MDTENLALIANYSDTEITEITEVGFLWRSLDTGAGVFVRSSGSIMSPIESLPSSGAKNEDKRRFIS